MVKMFMNMKKNKKGFTLVELMVVVAIIGILMLIAVPVYNNAQDTAKKNTCAANIRTINGAIVMYNASESTPIASGDPISKLVPNYVQSEPKCPSNGNYSIVTSGSAIVADCDYTGH